jgi:hypothetical protein
MCSTVSPKSLLYSHKSIISEFAAAATAAAFIDEFSFDFLAGSNNFFISLIFLFFKALVAFE